MTIRAAAKAVIIQDGKILLQCCHDDRYNLDYYELPGGGQHTFETMEQAVVRECLEETGYEVSIERFFALAEEIITTESVRQDYADHAHRILHIFLCHIKDVPQVPPSEADDHQVAIRWFPVDEAAHLRLRPTNLRKALSPLLASGEMGYLGTSALASLDT